MYIFSDISFCLSGEFAPADKWKLVHLLIFSSFSVLDVSCCIFVYINFSYPLLTP